MNSEEKIRKILGSQTTKKSIPAGAILDVLDGAASDNEKERLLGIALMERDSVDKQPNALEIHVSIDDDRWEILGNKYAIMTHEFVKSTYFETDSIEEYSKEMFRFLSFFKERDEKIFVFASMLYSSQFIPYRQLPSSPLDITKEKFNHLLQGGSEKRDLISYIAGLPFRTTTGEASVLLKVLDECEDNFELRSSLLAYYILKDRNRVKEMYENN